MTARIHMAGILRSARPARHLLGQSVHETRAVADEERCRREYALLRLAARVHRRACPCDLAHQRLLLALQARDELLLNLLPARGRGIARGYEGALARRGEPRRPPGQPPIVPPPRLAQP